jgi:hypothetical protein
MPNFFFGLTSFNVFMDFFVIFFSLGNMSFDDSPPRVRQRIKQSVVDKRHRIQLRQVLLEWNLLCIDLRDPVLLPIGLILLENQWENLYNCACLAFPKLVRNSMGTWSSSRMMTDDWLCRPWSEDSRFRLIHSLSVLWSKYLFYQSQEFLSLLVMRLPALTFYMISLVRDHRERKSHIHRSILVLLLLFTDS